MGRGHICGDMGMHWFDPRSHTGACVCGQVPEDIFFAAVCDCQPLVTARTKSHYANCAYVAWAQRRNEWRIAHKTERSIALVSVAVLPAEQIAPKGGDGE